MSGGSAAGGAAGGRAGGFATLEELLQAAPLTAVPEGVDVVSGRLEFTIPAGWSRADFAGGVALGSPPDAEGRQCQMVVFEPTPAPATEAARYQQLLDVSASFFPMGTRFLGQFGASDPLAGRRRGRGGGGTPFVGLDLRTVNESHRLLPYLMVFGTDAVTVVQIQPLGATCLTSPTAAVQSAVLFHSLWVTGTAVDPATHRQTILGNWFASSGSAAVGEAFGANGRYVFGGGTNKIIVESGTLYDVTSTFASDGTWALYGPVLALFPANTAPSSRLVRFYEEENSARPTGWLPLKCEVSRAVTAPFDLFEACLVRTE